MRVPATFPDARSAIRDPEQTRLPLDPGSPSASGEVANRVRAFVCGVLAAVLLFGSSVTQSIAAEKLKAVASFSILADLVHQVGGDHVDVTAIVGPDGDAHVFQPSPQDAKAVADANIVVINGLGLEGWMARLIQSSGTKAPVIVASKGVKPLQGQSQGEGANKGKADPHAWQSIANAKIYVTNIRDGLVATDPADKADFEANATDYLAKLDQLEAEVKAAIASIPPKNRKIITTHDAFGYFGRAYGMSFIAPQGVSTETEPSAKDVAKIIRQVKAQHVPAVFLENISDERLMQQIARESGAKIGGKLYSDALSKPGGGAATYVEMMQNNIAAFTKALRE